MGGKLSLVEFCCGEYQEGEVKWMCVLLIVAQSAQ